jgi:hypothetical protein
MLVSYWILVLSLVMVLILVICIVSILNSMESIPSIGSGSGGAGLRHWVRLTINTISKSAMMKPTSNILSFIMLQI